MKKKQRPERSQCPSCGGIGFEKSKRDENQCEFCDGTVGGAILSSWTKAETKNFERYNKAKARRKVAE